MSEKDVTRCKTLCRVASLLCTILALVTGAHAYAADWQLKLSMNIAEAYSDNIKLARAGKEQSDWVTQINPGMVLTAAGPGLKFSTRYQIQNQLYATTSQQNSTKHQLNTDVHAALVKNQVFIDGNASIGQQIVSAQGQQPISNINITANRANVVTLNISPYMQHRFEDLALGEMRYTHTEISSNAVGLANNQTDRLSLKLDSGTAFQTLGWAVNFHTQSSNYSNYVPTINGQAYSGDLRYSLTKRFALTGVAGFEQSDYIATGRPPTGAIYAAGFSWTPSERTKIDASAGSRFFGNNYALNAEHQSRMTTWNLIYNEDLTTTQAQFLANAALPNQPIPGPVNILSNQVFLQKSWRGSMSVKGRRNTVIVKLYDVVRDAQTPQTQNFALAGPVNQALGAKSKQLGGNAFWSSRISPHTTTSLMLGYVKTDFPALGLTSFDNSFMCGVNVQLQAKMNGLLEYRHNQHRFSQPIENYRENAITASLLMQF